MCIYIYMSTFLFTIKHFSYNQGQKNCFFDRFFDEKSVFDWVENDFGKEKSEVKKSEKNPRFFPGKKNF